MDNKYCDTCKRWDSRLVDGMCAECRMRYRVVNNQKGAYFTIELPESVVVRDLIQFLLRIDCTLERLPDGSLRAVPNRHSNSNVVKMPRRKRQYMHTVIPTGPEPA